MTTALIIICILACIGVVLAITGHLGWAIAGDRHWRNRIRRHRQAQSRRGN